MTFLFSNRDEKPLPAFLDSYWDNLVFTSVIGTAALPASTGPILSLFDSFRPPDACLHVSQMHVMYSQLLKALTLWLNEDW